MKFLTVMNILYVTVALRNKMYLVQVFWSIENSIIIF
jgi:hypothetical protein